MMIDVSKNLVDGIDNMIMKHHLEAEFKDTETSISAIP